MKEKQEEQKWALSTLAVFLILLFFAGISDFVEISIAICSFLLSWLVVSYSIRNFGKGGTSKEDLQKEMQVFSIILILVLGVFQLGIPYIFYTTAIKHVTALDLSLIHI